jgi:SnoaL-like protein
VALRQCVLPALLGLAACTTSRGPPRLTPRTAAGVPTRIEAMAREALLLDAAGDPKADTLYAAEAVVVGNARMRLSPPRFAGVGYGGRVTIAAVTVTLEGRFAWGLVDYRWFNIATNQAEAGRATFVFQEKPDGWRIIHVHSSQVLPWDR